MNNDKWLFLAPYPTVENIKDGMISRVKAIDILFEDTPRTYLNISLLRNIKKVQYSDGIVNVKNFNLILHFWSILNIIRLHVNVYSHSIYMLRFLWILIPKKNMNMTLDIHGVVPEEERYFKNNLLLSKYYSYVEYQVFRRINNAVCVTNSMKNHFVEKYPFYKGNYIIYSIMPDNLKEIDETQASLIKVRNEKRIEVIYSGGVQGWQNIDLMLQTIKKNQYSNIHYTILTGDKVTFENKIEEYNICSEFITVESRHPSELWKDYIAADYAFILRDENIVNNVANPTKLIEYLFYGLIPIVLSPNIGDYKELGYNYLLLNDFNENISKPDIAQKNIDIAHDLIKKNKLINMKQQVS